MNIVKGVALTYQKLAIGEKDGFTCDDLDSISREKNSFDTKYEEMRRKNFHCIDNCNDPVKDGIRSQFSLIEMPVFKEIFFYWCITICFFALVFLLEIKIERNKCREKIQCKAKKSDKTIWRLSVLLKL